MTIAIAIAVVFIVGLILNHRREMSELRLQSPADHQRRAEADASFNEGINRCIQIVRDTPFHSDTDQLRILAALRGARR